MIKCLIAEGGKRTWQKLESKMANPWIAHFADLNANAQDPVSSPSFAKESITRNPVLNVKRNLKLQESANTNKNQNGAILIHCTVFSFNIYVRDYAISSWGTAPPPRLRNSPKKFLTISKTSLEF